MKTILVACMLCVLIASSALNELTQANLDKIRLLIHEENKAIKADIANLKTETGRHFFPRIGIGICCLLPVGGQPRQTVPQPR